MCVSWKEVQTEYKNKLFPQKQWVTTWLQTSYPERLWSLCLSWRFSGPDRIKPEQPGLTTKFIQYWVGCWTRNLQTPVTLNYPKILSDDPMILTQETVDISGYSQVSYIVSLPAFESPNGFELPLHSFSGVFLPFFFLTRVCFYSMFSLSVLTEFSSLSSMLFLFYHWYI